jgi:hypothetical protein
VTASTSTAAGRYFRSEEFMEETEKISQNGALQFCSAKPGETAAACFSPPREPFT